MQLNIPEPDRCPPHCVSTEKNYCDLFKHYKMQECSVLLCPLNTLNEKNSFDRKKETNRELINRFDIRQCFVLITKAPIKFTDQRLLPKVLKKPNKSIEDKCVVSYSKGFLKESACNIFLENKGKQSVDFTRLYKTMYSEYWDLEYDSFIWYLYSLYEKFRLKNREALENISIVVDVPDSDNIREQQETLKRATSPHARSEFHKKTYKDFLEMREKRSKNSYDPKNEFPGNVAKSTQKKIKVFTQDGPTVEMFPKVPLLRRMEMHETLLKIKSEEIAQKISNAPHVEGKIKSWATALKIKKKALALKRKDKTLALKRKDKTLALKRKDKILDKHETLAVDNAVSETKGRESAMGILQEEPSKEGITNPFLPEVKEPVLERFINQPLPENVKADHLSEIKVRDPATDTLHVTVVTANASSEIKGVEQALGILQEKLPKEPEPDLERFTNQSLSEVKVGDSDVETSQKEVFAGVDPFLPQLKSSKLNWVLAQDLVEAIRSDCFSEIKNCCPPSEGSNIGPHLTDEIELDPLSPLSLEAIQCLIPKNGKEILPNQPAVEDMEVDNSLVEIKVTEPAMNLSQVQLFQESVIADQLFLNLTANEPPLEMLQEQLLIEADQPLPEIIENSGLEIPLLEKENADQIFTEILEDPPVLEPIKTNSNRNHSSE
ncbi:hypothetical protein TNIN_138181 [Trichonephila inaurata madagascariensis]|uniref:Uncharacterized protein n=1 Tax=Trichonephila inaurata madagascariensis TaxID=2747483 RepID=A0A8X6YAQ5_9ARAC|nr:hypothetical protein TNIN_138181 [Trichonephila inaurata madagascariensis]